MHDAYLAVLARDGAELSATSTALSEALDAKGLHVRYSSGRIALFGPQELPILPLPCGGILVGRLFERGGVALDNATTLPASSVPELVRQHIIEKCWGSYLVIQLDEQDPGYVTITSSPNAAGNLACVHSIRNGYGFLTSDISLAVHAGLYRKQIDWNSLILRLKYPNFKGYRTGLVGVTELLPGCSLRLGNTETVIDSAWSPWNFVGPERRHQSASEAAAEIRRAVDSAVAAWAGEDLSILLELSGGLDSSIVAACLRDRHAQIACYNLATRVPGVDERHYAALMAGQLGVELHVEYLDTSAASLEFPPAPDSVAPGMGPLQHIIDQIMERAAERNGATAYYSGGGGDSVFCYLRTAAPAADAFKTNGLGAAFAATRDLAHMHQCTLWKAGRVTLSKLRRPPASPYIEDASFIASDTTCMRPTLHPWLVAPTDALPGDRERIFDLAGNQLFEGQTSRGSRRPLRFPLLSQPVMEACLRAPSWMWVSGGRNRALAREAFSGALPADIVNRQSKATYMSYLGAFYEDNKRRIADFLLGGRLRSQGILDTGTISTFLAAPAPPRDARFLRMFDLCMTENWVRHQP